ncbi:serine--tRNA ligase [uncultured Parasphingopyxis sp.]|uniref:serine--tRNA ligase n=1 Tax=uncultured Parasphingopyxis sp. TaxID=1547918 RepID=UPI0026043C74|nr:serine--tRNA ligase [uncultured Parasphingopyxis sp.]
MHDLKAIRENPAAFDAAMARRGHEPIAATILALDEKNRLVLTELQELQARRNDASKAIGQAKAQGDEDRAQEMITKVANLKARIAELEESADEMAPEIEIRLSGLPNILHEDVPDGADENDNLLVHERGERRTFNYVPKTHDEIGAALGLDFEDAAKISGARFAVLRGPVARLNRAIAQFMLDLQTEEHGFTEVAPPLLVRDEAMIGTGQLPKFAEDSFQTTDGRWLIPTAEVSLTNLVRERILSSDELPLRFAALTPCFRSEAGSAGRDTKGLIRQHQFDKVEMVAITRAEDGPDEHERMTQCAETVLDRLELPYRRMLLCAGDTGFSSAKTFDLEVWLPGQDCYREISSVSHCTEFQARRMNARYRAEGEKQTRFAHTLNGSGLAVGRTLVAVLENYQQADGSITIPAALRPYMGGLETLTP